MLKLTAVIVILACAPLALGQKTEGVSVMKVSAETRDSVVFQMSVKKAVYGAQENIAVRYLVHNKGRKAIYLVTKDYDPTTIPDSWIAVLREPIDSPDAHTPYAYKMIKIGPGKSYTGTRTVEAKTLNDHPKYGFDVTEIQVGFAYIFDIKELNECSYSLPCLAKVRDEAHVVTLGNLVVARKVE
jgi:hypothetical protein